MSAPATPPPDPSLLTTLDRVLRGDYLRPEQLAAHRIELPARRLVRLALLLGAVYGICLGSFSGFHGTQGAWLQMLSSALKVPLLFLLTLVVTFPSLYVFAALQRLPLDAPNMLRLLLVAILIHLTVIASLGPVFGFFAASTDSYAFMKLLNVAFFALGGGLGFMVLRRATRLLSAGASDELKGGERTAERARLVLRTWCAIYGIVGAQMGWLLRPFLGSPELPFALFRPYEDNIFAGILRSIAALFGS